MDGISVNLWLDDTAEEAVATYTSMFPNSRVTGTLRYTEAGKEFHGHEPGSVMTIDFELDGFRLVALNGGAYFTLNPSVSLFINCATAAETALYWDRLSDGGTVLMPLDTYPFSERYGWVQDRFGVSWQIMVTDSLSHRIVPSLLFVGDVAGQAEEAIDYYASVFRRSSIGKISHYGSGQLPNTETMINHADFFLEGQRFAAMDSALDHDFGLNEAASFVINCDDQSEIDYYWDRLSASSEAEQCGWLKDKYGVSWQVVPTAALNRMMGDGDPQKIERMSSSLYAMKKLDLAALERAFASA